MSAWLVRIREIATTPLDARALFGLMRDLVFSEDAGALWRSPVGEVWERIKVVPSREFDTIEPPPTSVQAEAIRRLKADPIEVQAFNDWRRELGGRPLMLAKIDLRGRDLRGVDLRRCILFGADLRGADLRGCMLAGAVLKQAHVAGAQMEDDTLRGHDMEDLADALEDQEFHKYLRQMDRRRLAHIVSVSEQGKTFKNRKKIVVWRLKFHNNIRQTIKLKIWLDNGVHSEMVTELTLGGHESRQLDVEIERKQFPPERAVHLNTFLEGVNGTIHQAQMWAWDRASL
jgi:uncharacterized protein YjbI with pentapeptide repeats